MKSQSFLFKLLCALFGFGFGLQVSAQPVPGDVPGSQVDEADVTADVIELFDLAAEVYANLFQGASGWHRVELNGIEYIYQYFASSGIYAGVNDGYVYLLGGPFGNAVAQYGAIDDTIDVLITIRAGEDGGTIIDTGNDPVLSGDWTFVSEGKVISTVMGFTTESDFSNTIENFRAPLQGEDLEDVILEDIDPLLEEYASFEIKTMEVTMINNDPESRITFDALVEITAVTSGITVDVKLEMRVDWFAQ